MKYPSSPLYQSIKKPPVSLLHFSYSQVTTLVFPLAPSEGDMNSHVNTLGIAIDPGLSLTVWRLYKRLWLDLSISLLKPSLLNWYYLDTSSIKKKQSRKFSSLRQPGMLFKWKSHFMAQSVDLIIINDYIGSALYWSNFIEKIDFFINKKGYILNFFFTHEHKNSESF